MVGMAKSNTQNILPYLALIGSILALSFSALFVRWAAAPGPVMALYRLGMAAAIMTPFALNQIRGKVRLPWQVLLFPAVAGIFSAFDHTVWNISLGMTRAANATLLNNSAPLWVALVALVFFREPLRGRFWLGLALTLTGAGAVLSYDFLTHPTLGWGDLLALSSGLFYAGYYLATQLGREKLDAFTYTWLAGVSSTATLLIVNLSTRQPLTGYPPRTYLVFLAAAVISQIGGYIALSYALGRLPASVVSPTMIAQPVITALMAVPLLGESLYLPQVAGGLTVLAGIYLVHVSRQQAQLEPEVIST